VSNPLTLHHEKLGAQFGPRNAPLQYASSIEEYWTIKKHAGIADISNVGRLIISGKDRTSWLNGLVTNDLGQVKENIGIHSVLLNTKARVLADLYVYSFGDDFLIDTGDASAGRIKQLLEEFIISEQVQIKDSTVDLVHLTIQGPESSRAVKEALGIDVSNLRNLQSKHLGPSIIIARDRTGMNGYDIILPSDESEPVWQGFLLKTGDLGVKPVGAKSLDILRLEAGIPKYGVDVDENNIVLEAGYKDAISYSKGCYMGQEVVARATHIGRVNKQLAKLEIESEQPIAPGSKLIVGDRDAGFVTSSAFSPGLKLVVALGYVNRDFAKEDTKLTIQTEKMTSHVTVRGLA
jgi:folate-binding protein YgfZ